MGRCHFYKDIYGLCYVLFYNVFQSGTTACVAPDYFYILPLCFIHSRFHHLMRYGVGKENEQVRGPHLLVHAGRHLCKYLCLAFIVLTDLHILTDHPVMSSYNYNTHENGTSCSFILLISFQVPQVFLLLHHPEHHSR